MNLPKYRLGPAAAFCAAVLLAGFSTLLALWCQPNAFRGVAAIFLRQPALIVLNALPVGLLLLALSFLCRNVFFGAALTNLLAGGLSLANRVKILVRDEPLFPRDFSLLKELGSIVGTYRIQYPVGVIAVVVLTSALLGAAGVFIGVKPCTWEKLRGWKGSLLGAAVFAAALALSIHTFLASPSLHDSLETSNPYRLSTVFNETGFPYNFCYQFTTYLVDKPAGYSKAQAAAWDGENTGEGETGKAVNVIFVMNEAFSDISDDPVFHFTEENDPLPNLHALGSDPHAFVGRVVVPGFAGGTANTEFDVLTGMQTNTLGSSTSSAMRTVNRNIDSLFRVFGADGYHTSFFHPGDDWFYNRENVYRWMGAEETRFADEMTDIRYKGRWVTDDYMADLIEDELDSTAAQGKLLFHYTTTIQNHMAFTYGKYGEDYDYPPVPVEGTVSDAAREILEVYIEGARDADAMLGRLCAAFSERKEPVVLVFFGDHLPYLGEDLLCYAELGMDVAKDESARANPLCSYETPCVIWGNDAAAETLDWDRAIAALDLPADGRLSASFLGAAVLELTGRGRATAWYAFLNALRRELPVVQKHTYRTLAGETLYDDAMERLGLDQELLKWRQWTFYKLQQKEIPA